jgi:hypothetical protein
MKRQLFILYFLFISVTVIAQNTTLENSDWRLSVRENGTISSLLFKQSNTQIAFNRDDFAGPSWYFQLNDEIVAPASRSNGENKFTARYDNLTLSVEYKDENGTLLILATVKNTGHIPFQPEKLGLRLGIDTYMDKYPDWERKLFPTLLRCEQTHLWGYFMSPVGKILVIASPDPIASWSHEYSKSWGREPYKYQGHRITSVNLDLINALPLPERHPQHLWQLKPGETKTFHIYLDEVKELNQVTHKVAELFQAPVIDMAVTSYKKGDRVRFSVNSTNTCTVDVITPEGSLSHINSTKKNFNKSFYAYNETKREGLYFIKVTSKNGKISKASFYVRKPYSWYMKKAMQAVIDYPQKASKTHCESWYGFYTSYAGGKYFPDNKNVLIADEQFDKIFPIVIDTTIYEPFESKHRILNVSTLIGILVDRYQLYKDENDLQAALRLSEFLLKAQTPDGAYRANKTHYTSVIYIAKSLMELLDVLSPLEPYKQHYDKIYASVKMAMDELALNKSNVQTEGELTFEDGMIGCTSLQLGMFALLQTNKEERTRYKEAALYLLDQHRCLQQLLIPDARMRSATLRFWEAQYDVVIANNFFNSPHGWSSWTTYANYYAYQLTGDTKYLIRTFNGLDAAMQMIDLSDGSLRWAFAVNPYLKLTQIDRNIDGATPLDFTGMHYHTKKYTNRQYIVGEEYINMVSDWFYADANDNNVHEHFKCLEEIALRNAFIAENDRGELLTYNCSAELKDGQVIILPEEKIITNVHINLKNKYTVKAKFGLKTVEKILEPGMVWISAHD